MKKHWAILTIFSVALLLRVGFGLTLGDPVQSFDEAHWDGWGISFLKGGGLFGSEASTFRPPLYPLFLAGIYGVFGHSYTAVRIAQSVLGVLMCWVVYRLGTLVFDRRTGIIAGAATAVYPYFVFFSGVLMAETLLILLVLSVVGLSVRMARSGVIQSRPYFSHAAALGVCLGLAALCKPVAFVIFPCIVLWRMVDGRGSEWKRRFREWGVILSAMILTCLPWSVRNYAVSGAWVWVASNGGINLLVGNHPEATGVYRDGYDYVGYVERIAPDAVTDVEQDRAATREGVRLILGNPGRFVRLAWAKALGLWTPFPQNGSPERDVISLGSYGPVLMLAGIAVVRYRRRWRELSLFYLAFAAFSAVHMVFFAHVRFRLPLDGLLIVLASGTVSGFLKMHRKDAKDAENPLGMPRK